MVASWGSHPPLRLLNNTCRTLASRQQQALMAYMSGTTRTPADLEDWRIAPQGSWVCPIFGRPPPPPPHTHKYAPPQPHPHPPLPPRRAGLRVGLCSGSIGRVGSGPDQEALAERRNSAYGTTDPLVRCTKGGPCVLSGGVAMFRAWRPASGPLSVTFVDRAGQAHCKEDRPTRSKQLGGGRPSTATLLAWGASVPTRGARWR